MKIKITTAILSFSLLLLATCSKDKAPVPDTCNSTVAVSYATDIKPILDANCATVGCHNTATNQSGYDYSSYASAKDGVPASICKIKGTCGSIMPPTGKLADSLICKIESWKAQNYPN